MNTIKPEMAAYILCKDATDYGQKKDKIISYLNQSLPGGECTVYIDSKAKRHEYDEMMKQIRLEKFTDVVIIDQKSIDADGSEYVPFKSMIDSINIKLHIIDEA